MTTHAEARIAAPPHLVWRALRDPDQIRRWHGWDYDGLDEEIRQIYLDDATEDMDRQMLVVAGGDRFSIRPSDTGTTVRLTRPERDATAGDEYDEITDGWWAFLQQLRFALECHDLAERRTLMLQRAGSGGAELLDAVVAQAGGEVLSRTESHVAVVVDDAGPGLVVLTQRPGGTTLVLTTYGLADEAFEATTTRWTTWWDAA